MAFDVTLRNPGTAFNVVLSGGGNVVYASGGGTNGVAGAGATKRGRKVAAFAVAIAFAAGAAHAAKEATAGGANAQFAGARAKATDKARAAASNGQFSFGNAKIVTAVYASAGAANGQIAGAGFGKRTRESQAGASNAQAAGGEASALKEARAGGRNDQAAAGRATRGREVSAAASNAQSAGAQGTIATVVRASAGAANVQIGSAGFGKRTREAQAAASNEQIGTGRAKATKKAKGAASNAQIAGANGEIFVGIPGQAAGSNEQSSGAFPLVFRYGGEGIERDVDPRIREALVDLTEGVPIETLASIIANGGLNAWMGDIPDFWGVTITGTGGVYPEGFEKYEGAYSAAFRVGAFGDVAEISQSLFAAKSSAIYRVRFRYKTELGALRPFLIAESGGDAYRLQPNGTWALGAEDFYTGPLQSATWAESDIFAVLPDNLTKLIFGVRNEDGDRVMFYVDDVRIEGPFPAGVYAAVDPRIREAIAEFEADEAIDPRIREKEIEIK